MPENSRKRRLQTRIIHELLKNALYGSITPQNYRDEQSIQNPM